MLLRQMKYFLTVADCKSFSEAAEQCYISQSAISQQMKVLEDELGAELIRRSNRRFQLTEIGDYFYTRSKAIVKETEDLKAKIKQMQKNQNKLFRIGCRNGYMIRRLCSAMNTYLLEHKDMDMDVIYGDHDELMTMLQRDELDMVFNDLRHETEENGFGHIFIEQIEGLVAVSNRSTLANKESVNTEDLSEYPCILLASEKNQEKEKSFFKMIFQTENNFLLAKDVPSALTMIVNNSGFMPLVSNTDAHDIIGRFTKLLPVKRTSESMYIKYFAFYNKEKLTDENKKIMEAVLELLK